MDDRPPDDITRLRNEIQQLRGYAERISEESATGGSSFSAFVGGVDLFTSQVNHCCDAIVRHSDAVRSRLELLRSRCTSLTQENMQLYDELKGLSSGRQAAAISTSEDSLRRELERTRLERDEAEEQLASALKGAAGGGIDSSAPYFQQLQDQVLEIKQNYEVTLLNMRAEVEAVRLDKSKYEADLAVIVDQLEATKNQLTAEKITLGERDADLMLLRRHVTELEERGEQLEKCLLEENIRVQQANENMQAASRDKTVAETAVAACRLRLSDCLAAQTSLEEELAATQKLADDYLAERDAAIGRAEQLQEQVESGEQTVKFTIEEAGQKTRREVELVRTQMQRQVDLLQEEINRLTLEIGEKNSQLERAARDRRALDVELQRLAAELANNSGAEGHYTELTRRAVAAEAARDAANIQICTQKGTLKQLTQELENSKLSHQRTLEATKKKLREANECSEDTKRRQVSMSDQLAGVEKLLRQTREEKLSIESDLRRQVMALEDEVATLTETFKSRLTGTEAGHATHVEEVQQLVLLQREMLAKWRSQADSARDQHDKETGCLRKEVCAEKHRSRNLQSTLEKKHTVLVDIEEQLATSRKQTHKSETLARDRLRKLRTVEQQLLVLTTNRRTVSTHYNVLESEHIEMSQATDT